MLVDLYKVCSYDALGVKSDPAGGGGKGSHKLEHGNKEPCLENSSLKLEAVELSYLVYSISLRTSTKFVYIIPPSPGQN